jgi:hypothetical protein
LAFLENEGFQERIELRIARRLAYRAVTRRPGAENWLDDENPAARVRSHK